MNSIGTTPSSAPSAASAASRIGRTLLALGVVLVMLATTGWSALPHDRFMDTPREAARAAWAADRSNGGPLPGPGSSASDVARFFATLPLGDRLRLVTRHPLVVGNLDGVPIDLRYRANRRALALAHRAELRRTHDRRLTPSGLREAVRRTHRFAALQKVNRQVLAFDPTGGGRVAEVFGDLQSAERVSVVVPGVDTDVLSFEKSARRYTATAGMASALYAAERAAAPNLRTAVIAWADYTAPEGIGMDAATGRLATDGALRLESLLGALPDRSTTALFCHSYGSVVCGVAAHHLPARVTDLVVAGSPGMRTPSVTALRTQARVWAVRSADDWIADVPYLMVGGLGHGADPVEPEFGARVLSAAGSHGHAGYFEPGTESVTNFARIGVGSFESVSCAGAEDTCRRGIYGPTGQ
ncbi:alpha/beta hydrolase [Streptomyces sp. NPDC006879]|uniref:alpha/beta hydrolase n=1 Tax=Streptomyces sp. NPDC006879 TaxID=3364767 RepID=UPI0036AAC365